MAFNIVLYSEKRTKIFSYSMNLVLSNHCLHNKTRQIYEIKTGVLIQLLLLYFFLAKKKQIVFSAKIKITGISESRF